MILSTAPIQEGNMYQKFKYLLILSSIMLFVLWMASQQTAVQASSSPEMSYQPSAQATLLTQRNSM